MICSLYVMRTIQANSRPSSASNASPHTQRPQANQQRQSSLCIKVARDQDFQDQIGSHQWFDLMDPNKVSAQHRRTGLACRVFACPAFVCHVQSLAAAQCSSAVILRGFTSLTALNAHQAKQLYKPAYVINALVQMLTVDRPFLTQ